MGSSFELLPFSAEDGIRYTLSSSAPAPATDVLGGLLQNLQIFATSILIKSEGISVFPIDPDITDGKTRPAVL